MVASGLVDGTYRCHQRPTALRNDDGSARRADDSHIQPILRGFVRWLETMQRRVAAAA